MLKSLMKFSTIALAVLGLQLAANAQSLATRQTPAAAAAAAARRADEAMKERINAWTSVSPVGSSKALRFVLRQRLLAL